MLNALGGGPTLGQTQFKMVLDSCEEILKAFCCSIQEALQKLLLVWLQAAGNAVLIHTAAAIGQAALAEVLAGAGVIDITAAVHQQILPLTDKTQLVCEENLALDGVPTLVDLTAAVSQVKVHFPVNAVVGVPGLQKDPVSYSPLLLLEGAGQEVNEGQSKNDPENPTLPEELAQHHGAVLHLDRPGAS